MTIEVTIWHKGRDHHGHQLAQGRDRNGHQLARSRDHNGHQLARSRDHKGHQLARSRDHKGHQLAQGRDHHQDGHHYLHGQQGLFIQSCNQLAFTFQMKYSISIYNQFRF